VRCLQNASEEEKALFLQTAEEAAQNLETANFLLTTSIVADALRSYDTFLPDAKASQQQQQDYLAQAVEKERPNAQARELNSLGFWKGNLLEQKLLQAQIENAIQRAQLQNAAGEPDKALKILVASLRDSSSVFENYLEVTSHTPPHTPHTPHMRDRTRTDMVAGAFEYVVAGGGAPDLPHR
jgi:hypothetical protein